MKTSIGLIALALLFALGSAEPVAAGISLAARGSPAGGIVLVRASDLDLYQRALPQRPAHSDRPVGHAQVLYSIPLLARLVQRSEGSEHANTLDRRGGGCSKGSCFRKKQPASPSSQHNGDHSGSSEHAGQSSPEAQLPPLFHQYKTPLDRITEGSERSPTSSEASFKTAKTGFGPGQGAGAAAGTSGQKNGKGGAAKPGMGRKSASTKW
ncbi:hypothetical protein OC835_002213 [Tilletia horrida]|nr:hypothetical protein OC835_002213 [Tilletia horrida]